MKLLLTGCFNYTEDQKDKIHSLGYDIYFLAHEADVLPLAAEEVEATVCNGLFLNHDIEDFKKIKFIQLTSAGLDRVPVAKIKEKNITLMNARGVYNTPMAEWVVFRVLEHFKQGWFFKKEQENIHWTKYRGLRELKGSKIAVIGAGNVGQEVAKLFKAFDTIICGFDIHTNETPYFDEMALTDTLEERVAEFDVMVVTVPLLPSTYHLISERILLNMKRNATLVNIARGSLIEESVLCNVLEKRADLFAALDVFESEPLSANSRLWQLDNVALSPHNSFVSDRNNERMFTLMYNNLRDYITSKVK